MSFLALFGFRMVVFGVAFLAKMGQNWDQFGPILGGRSGTSWGRTIKFWSLIRVKFGSSAKKATPFWREI